MIAHSHVTRPADIRQTVRRILAALFAAQSLAALGVTAALTIGTIVVPRLSGQSAFAGLPMTVYLLGAALGAFPAGLLMDRLGRRSGLALGFVVALVGSALAVAAIVGGAFVVLLVGFALMGLGRSATEQGRFAAAEVVSAAGRARAVSWIVLGGTIGGIGGPLLLGPSGRLAVQLGLDELAGPFLVTAILMALGMVVIMTMLRPDPREVGRSITPNDDSAGAAPRSFLEIARLEVVQLALVAMVLGQLVMVIVMVITPLHMTSQHHGLDAVSWVIAAHVAGMYGLSVVTGHIADKFGRSLAIGLGALILSAACFFAQWVASPVWLAVALFLLGLGWNFCYVAGSSLLSDALRPGERGRMQGSNDLIVGLVSAAGSLGSGLVFATVGYTGIALVGMAITAGLFAALLLIVMRRPRLAGAVAGASSERPAD